MTYNMRDQLQHFIQGFYSLIPKKALRFVRENDLMIKLAGVNKIDIMDMRKNTVESGFSREEKEGIIEWYWELLEEMDNH